MIRIMNTIRRLSHRIRVKKVFNKSNNVNVSIATIMAFGMFTTVCLSQIVYYNSTIKQRMANIEDRINSIDEKISS